jgi:hypothetical protein
MARSRSPKSDAPRAPRPSGAAHPLASDLSLFDAGLAAESALPASRESIVALRAERARLLAEADSRIASAEKSHDRLKHQRVAADHARTRLLAAAPDHLRAAVAAAKEAHRAARDDLARLSRDHNEVRLELSRVRNSPAYRPGAKPHERNATIQQALANAERLSANLDSLARRVEQANLDVDAAARSIAQAERDALDHVREHGPAHPESTPPEPTLAPEAPAPGAPGVATA